VVLQLVTNVSEERVASTFSVEEENNVTDTLFVRNIDIGINNRQIKGTMNTSIHETRL
jgi:hypothetical protein